MIISASYKTDIPTFYGSWFMNWLRAGFCKMVNPYGRQVHRVSLLREDVDGFVFWTKNIAPFVRYLPEIRDRGFPFFVQHTINRYPRELETSVVDAAWSVESVRKVRNEFGPRAVVWRYDTIVISSITSMGFHRQNFSELAESLRGVTDEVVISFATLYDMTRRNLNAAADRAGFSWQEPAICEKQELVAELVRISAANDMRLTVCSQKNMVVGGAGEARCIDARRMEDVSDCQIKSRIRGNRNQCGCFESRDIGEYDTCPHGCVYCYAVQNRSLALERYRSHNPDSEFLFAPAEALDEVRQVEQTPQFKLFGQD